MAMPSGNAIMPEKMQFPGASSGVNEIHFRQQWFMDERDGFIGWIRSEFAAANAIIDSLCHHLRAIGDPGEYDVVIGAIQQRRCNWTQVLLMQQYFSVSEVTNALQQVAWRRQQRHVDYPVKPGGKEFRKFRQGQRFDAAKEGHHSGVEYRGREVNSVVAGGTEKGTHITEKNENFKSDLKVETMDDKSLASAEEKKDNIASHQYDGVSKSSRNSQRSLSSIESEVVDVSEECISNSRGNDSHSLQNQLHSQNASTRGKTFNGTEMFDGKMVNVVDGLEQYDDLFDSNDVSKLVSLVNDLRVAGKRGQFQGSQTFVVSKRPMKGHGREMIQLGVPIADAPPDVDNVTGSTKDKNVESIPSLFQDIIDRMVASQVMAVKPDACIVDFFNEGDHSQPNNWPAWFGRPVYMLFLTECDMTFGRTIVSDHPGDFRGTVKISLVPGSLLVMQGKSADLAKHAIPFSRKHRTIVTFTKSQPRKSLPVDAQRLASLATPHWAPPPSRSPNHVRHQSVPKHYAAAPATGVLPAPSTRPPPNGMQPLFVLAPVATPMPFPAPVPIPPGSAGGWTPAPPRHPHPPPPRLPLPGTGVFLPPPGSGSSSQPLPGTLTEVNVNPSVGTPTILGKESGKSNHHNINASASPNGKVDGDMQKQECNGNANGTEVEQVVEKEQKSNGKAVESH